MQVLHENAKECVKIHLKNITIYKNQLLVENYTTHIPVERFFLDQPIRDLTVTMKMRRVPKKLSSNRPLSGAGE